MKEVIIVPWLICLIMFCLLGWMGDCRGLRTKETNIEIHTYKEKYKCNYLTDYRYPNDSLGYFITADTGINQYIKIHKYTINYIKINSINRWTNGMGYIDLDTLNNWITYIDTNQIKIKCIIK